MGGHLLCGHGELLWFQLIKKFQQFFHDGFLQKSINKIDTCVPAAGLDALSYDIEIRIEIQDFVQAGCIFF